MALLLEDNRVDAELFLQAFNEACVGCRCDVAYNAAEARELMARNDYNVLFIDLLLPGENGVDFLQYLRSIGVSRKAIIVTGVADVEMVKKALSFGAVSFIVKPVTADKLRPIIS